jgi:hypothetical protein
MRKPGVVSVIITVILLVGSVIALSYAQTPAPSDTPTFYHLVPGTYVNGWPRFTITYPKDWVERPPNFNIGQCFSASTPGSYRANIGVYTHNYRITLPLGPIQRNGLAGVAERF